MLGLTCSRARTIHRSSSSGVPCQVPMRAKSMGEIPRALQERGAAPDARRGHGSNIAQGGDEPRGRLAERTGLAYVCTKQRAWGDLGAAGTLETRARGDRGP